MKDAGIEANKPLFREARQVPFFRFLFFYIFGVLTGRWLEPTPTINNVLWLLLIALLLAFYSSYFFFRGQSAGSTALSSTLFYLFLYILGWLSLWQPHPSLNARHYSHFEGEYLVGYIDDELRATTSGYRFPIRISHVLGKEGWEEATGRLMVSLRGSGAQTFRYGDELLLPARHRPTLPPLNPGEFDYRNYLKNQAIWHRIFLPDTLVHRRGSQHGNWLKHKALGLRAAWVQKLRQSLKSDENFAIASALVLGYRGVLEPETLHRFSKTGTIHVLSVSGLHVGIVFAVFSFLLRWIKGKHLDLLKAIMLVSSVWMYALLTGLSPSVLRAATMISFGIIAMTLYRRPQMFNTICASALFLLLYNPAFLFEVGFVLSYLAVIGIVSLHPIIRSIFPKGNSLLSALISYASISVAAQLATFPFVFYYFHIFPVYFLPANMLIILPATLVVYLSATVLILPSGGLHSLASYLLERVMEVMNSFLRFFEALPYATLEGVRLSASENALIYLLIVLMYLLFWFRKKVLLYLIILTCGVGVLGRSFQELTQFNRSEIVFYNVNRDFALSFIENSSAFVLSNLSPNSPSLQYSVLPHVNGSTKSPPLFIRENESLRHHPLLIDSGLVQFREHRLFIYSSHREFSGSIDVDFLYIRNNSLKDLPSFARTVRFRNVILDGSNHDAYVKRIKKDAEILGTPIYILKNNYAYVW